MAGGCPLGGKTVAEIQSEQEKNGEKHPDLSFPPVTQVSIRAPHWQNNVKPDAMGAWESHRAADRVRQSRAGKGMDGSEDTQIQEYRRHFV